MSWSLQYHVGRAMRRMLTVTLTFPITFMVVGFLYFTFRIIALGEFTRER